MSSVWFWSLGSVAVVSLVSLVGIVTLAVNERRLQGALIFLVSFAVGALFGDAFLHILPEAFEHAHPGVAPSLLVLLGIFIFFVLEKFIYWRHCHAGVCDFHEKPVVWLNLVGDGVHNFIDGVLLAASYGVSFSIGIATTLAVVFHEIPQEIGDFGILIHGGFSRRRALGYNFLCSLSAFAGAVALLLMGPSVQGLSHLVTPVAAGGFIYIAGSDLIPELHREPSVSRSLLQFGAIGLGVGIMALLLLFE